MEQDLKPALYLQVRREFADLMLQGGVNGVLIDMFGSHQIEKFDEVVEWINEVEEFKDEVRPEIFDQSVENSFWCNNMISRIRKIRAKRGSNFTFQRAISDVVSSSKNIAPPPWLHEELCFQIMLLATVVFCNMSAFAAANGDLNSYFMDERRKPVVGFLDEIKPQLQGKIPEENYNWYLGNIAKAKTLIEECEPGFCFLSQHLHEELGCEVRSLIFMISADSASCSLPYDRHEFKKELEDWKNEVTKFLRRINLQLQEEIPEKNSNWYRNKIVESRTLIAKRHSAFPLQSQYQYVDCSKELGQLFLTEQDTHNKVNIPTVESKAPAHDVGYSKERYQIFLSFRGQDTRYTFTGFLYKALCETGFKVFMDDGKLHKGDPVTEEVIMEAIENSKFSIIIFSKKFAKSTFCLNQVVKILECKKKKKQLVLPVFYKVEPLDVRDKENNYAKAIANHKVTYGSEKAKNWKSALYQVSGLDTFRYKNNNGISERDFIQGIVKEVNKYEDQLKAWM